MKFLFRNFLKILQKPLNKCDLPQDTLFEISGDLYNQKKEWYDLYILNIEAKIKNFSFSEKEIPVDSEKTELKSYETVYSLLDPLGKV